MDNILPVRIFNSTPWSLPNYESDGASGFDLRAALQDAITIKPLERALIPTGIFVELPIGFEITVRPRSGLAAKFGISIVNTPGTVDADYRGQIHVNLINLGNTDFKINPGDRIAQGVILPVFKALWIPVSSEKELSVTTRGEKGHGSTGI